MAKHPSILGLFLFYCGLALADYPLEIIELKGRSVDEIIPLVAPFAGPDGVVSGMNNQLIIRAAPERLEDIRKILQRFDRAPRNLIIRVHQGNMTTQERERLRAGVNVGIGEHARIGLGKPVAEDSIQIRAGNRHTLDLDDTTHRIRATEGKPAFIATGKSIPIQEQNTYISGGIIHQQTATRYRDVTGGFYVIPQLNGNQVTLRISPHMDRPGKVAGTFDIQRADTTIVGRLGEWISIANVDHSSTGDSSGTLHQYSTQGRQDSQIYLLVEEAP